MQAERINCEELISRVVHFIVQFTLILWAMNSRKGVRGRGQGFWPRNTTATLLLGIANVCTYTHSLTQSLTDVDVRLLTS